MAVRVDPMAERRRRLQGVRDRATNSGLAGNYGGERMIRSSFYLNLTSITLISG